MTGFLSIGVIMKKYSYSGEDSNGKSTLGTVEAETREEALTVLGQRDLIITSLKETGEEGKDAPFHFEFKFATQGDPKVSLEDLSSFAYEMSALLGAGVSLPNALELQLTEKRGSGFNEVIKDVLKDVRAGTAFSKALGDHPDTFPPIYSALVRASEGSGTLEKSMQSLSDYFESLNEIRNRIITAMSYPIFVVICAIILLSGLFIFAVPKFANIYTQIGVPLPLFTRIMVDIGQAADKVIVVIIVVLILFSIPIMTFIRSGKGSLFADRLKLKIPLMGSIMQEIAIANFCKNLAVLNQNGVGLIESVDLSAHACGNSYIINELLVIEKPLNEGKMLSEALKSVPVFPAQVIGMLEAGEKSGKLSEMLRRMADFSNRKVEHQTERLMSFLEPMLILMVGLFVGTAIIALALPILNISSEIQPN